MSGTTAEPAVLVTGASKGIGQACAHRLADRGWRVFAGVRSDADADRIRRSGIVPVMLDITNEAMVRAAAEYIEAETAGAGLAGLVNNAGVAVAGPLEFLPTDRLRWQFEVNVVGQLAVTRALLPALRRASGRIVFIGSISGRSALPFTGAYAASKHALEAVADALRVELMPWGLRVSMIEPGVIATPIWDTALKFGEETMAAMPARATELYGRTIEGLKQRALRGRQGRHPDTVARAVEHALTAARPRVRYVVGRDARMRLLFQRLPVRVRDRIIARALKRL